MLGRSPQQLKSIGATKALGPDGFTGLFCQLYWSLVGCEDNLILVHEAMQILKRKSGRGGLLAVKVDMEKAYDKVDWDFLMAILHAFGFSSKWCHWIFQFISTVSFSILLNGSPYGFFRPKCGLRQGDPLSPFLFVMVTEVLMRLIKKEEDRGILHGLQIAKLLN